MKSTHAAIVVFVTTKYSDHWLSSLHGTIQHQQIYILVKRGFYNNSIRSDIDLMSLWGCMYAT